MEKVVCNQCLDFTLPNRIKNKDYKLLKVLKDDDRSYVILLEIEDQQYVYKIPKEKNFKKWQRLISLFRGSESKREYENYFRILENGFNGPKPIMYWEKKVFGMSFDSFLVTSFINGESAKLENLDLVNEELKRIHEKGFLHGDSQLDNFLISEDKLFLVDAKLSTNKYGKIGEAYEFIYLEESCHEEIDIYDKETKSYKIAKALNSYLHWLGRIKKVIRRKGK
ncbi:MAG: lipopolysaccharide core heptose(II) kinase RfaY [Cetobacterium sp.]